MQTDTKTKAHTHPVATHRVLLPALGRWVRCNEALAKKWQQIIGGHRWHVEEAKP
jgi:hypothetical protein